MDQATPHESSSSSRQVWLVGLMASALALVFVVLLLVKHQGDAMQFVHIGTFWRYHIPYPEGTNGYDGQYFYYIARYGLAGAEFMDNASWRFMRILYPLLVVALSVGQPGLMPWMMLVINIAAVGVAAGCVAWLLYRWGAPPLFGLLFPLWIGVLISLALDLSELMMLALALAGLVAYLRRQIPLAIVLFVLSVMTKEIGILFVGGAALHASLTERRWREASLIAAIPTAFYLVWFVAVYQLFGILSVAHDGSRMVPFFLGLVQVWHEYPDRFGLAFVTLIIPFVVLTGVLARHLLAERRLSISAAVLIVSLVYVFSLPYAIWREPISVLRNGTPLIVAGVLFLGQHYPRRLLYIGAFCGVLLALLPFLLPNL